ncbi:MAG: AAA family ATPase [Oscillospiraceae bacterium]|jgi:hypothetical protein|nr:AAA family ATPase [Oscillospiraceae bacterium]
MPRKKKSEQLTLDAMCFSDEQQGVLDAVSEGRNVLVDACIGSGKTTVLQEIFKSDVTKNVLYLTFNKLLKNEAKKRLGTRKGSTVTNYHGFVYPYLIRANIKSDIENCLTDFVSAYEEGKIYLPNWDILLIDEYQDINENSAKVIECVKKTNPSIQIVIVGDMAQKIYDATTLDVSGWVDKFLDEYTFLQLSNCFRLSADHAGMLGRIWGKEINGKNSECIVKTVSMDEALEIASELKPVQLLCLGMRGGELATFQNLLESEYPEIYNKKTLYSSIRDEEQSPGDNSAKAAIFTTYDSSKGMERDVCMVFNFTANYWGIRTERAGVSYEIMRNIFCVAASRGKKAVYFVDSGQMLNEEILSTPTEIFLSRNNEYIDGMFDFKFKEQVDKCFKMLEIEELEVSNRSLIEVTKKDCLIDLTPCIGYYQLISYFVNFSAKTEWESLQKNLIIDKLSKDFKGLKTAKQYVLALTAARLSQMRYVKQVSVDFMNEEAEAKLHGRFGELFTPDETVQVKCELKCGTFTATGLADVVKDNVAYQLVFADSLNNTQCLITACYALGLGCDYGVLWNLKDNKRLKISVKNSEDFLKQVEKTVCKVRDEKILASLA